MTINIKRSNQRYLPRFESLLPSWTAYAEGRYITRTTNPEVLIKPRPKVWSRVEYEIDLMDAFYSLDFTRSNHAYR